MSHRDQAAFAAYDVFRKEVDVNELTGVNKEIYLLTRELKRYNVKIMNRKVIWDGEKLNKVPCATYMGYSYFYGELICGGSCITVVDSVKNNSIASYSTAIQEIVKYNSSIVDGYILFRTNNSFYLLTWGSHFPEELNLKKDIIPEKEYENDYRLDLDGFMHWG